MSELTYSNLQDRIPEILHALHPNGHLTIVGFAANDERRRLLNHALHLGGVRFPTYQHTRDNRVVLNTFVYPLEVAPSIFRGRTNLMVLLDSQIADQFRAGKVSEEDNELARTLLNCSLTVAKILKADPAELYFDINL